MNCNICSHASKEIFTKQVLGKYPVKYFKCERCGFVQTETPHWLHEAYENIITVLDIGLVGRNHFLSIVTQAILTRFFDTKAKFLDFGGGYGMFVRLMRDEGFGFYRQDKFCENLFAKNFDIDEQESPSKFEVLTAFEVFEHLPDPISEIKVMLGYSDSILFSTELQPENQELSSWKYLIPETGQHVALYSLASLQEIARMFNLNLYTNRINLHLLTPKKINQNIFSLLTRRKVALLHNALMSKNASLLQKDYDFAKEKANRQTSSTQ